MRRALVILLLSACVDEPAAKCTLPEMVKGQIIVGAPLKPIVADFTVRGTIDVPADRTIYGVDVAGIPATNGSTNFNSWSVVVPLPLLIQNADADGKLTLKARATSNCGGDPIEVGTLDLEVDLVPSIQVTELKLTTTLPNGQTYLPATKPVSAVITVTGNATAAGAVVTLTPSSGTVSPASVTLSGDGMAASSATVLFSSTTEGVAVVSASAKGQTAVATVPVAGAPALTPAGGVLPLGSTTHVTVLTTGKIDTCQASPSPGLTVFSGTQNLMVQAGGIDTNSDTRIDMDVSAGGTRTDPMQTTITCRDVFGQVGSGTFSGPPPPTP
jgi:hypothetical protein